MRVIGVEVLDAFCCRHADVDQQVRAWVAEAKQAQWRKPMDIKGRYPCASFLKGGRVVFNLKGNKYRLLARVGYKSQIVRVLEIGTHAEYDTWNL